MEKINLEKNIEDSSYQGNDTILVWLDFGPYSYIHLGIISELNKLKKYDFIGIVTKHQDLSYFQNQKFIQFKELFYYPEYYIGKSNFSIEKLKKIEEQFDLNLWLDIFSERSFYYYWTDFHKFTREEILAVVENSVLFFINILEKFKPKKILMQQAGETISNLLLYKIAKKMRIETLMPINLHLRNRIHISNNFTSREIVDEYQKIRLNFKRKGEKFDEKFLRERDHTITVKTVSSFDSSIPTTTKKIRHYLKRLSNDLEPTYTNVGKTRFKMIKHGIDNYFKIKKRKQFLDKYASQSIRENKFLYFPLQSEPEATILAFAPFFSNQIGLVETVAKAIPIDTVLYVKEHPTQKDKFWRSVEDYKKIINIPNVRLLHPSVNSLELIEKSEGIISISGSTGFEALFYKKPVIIFGDEHYENLPMVTKIKNMNKLAQEIKTALTEYRFDEDELNIFMEVFNKQSLKVHYSDIMKEGVSLSAIQRNGENFNTTNKHFKEYTVKYEKDFKIIANAIFSRIQKNYSII